MSVLTIEKLKALLSYDPETGIFMWVGRGKGIRHGRRAGSVEGPGYRIIRLYGEDHLAQRLAWFWVHGEWPRLIRFQNSDKDDCRIDNLRDGFCVETKYNHRTKEGRAAYQAEYRSERREEFVAKERERKFGVSVKQYSDMYLAQGGCCAICRRAETATRNGKVKTLAVDHDHATGAVRGLLCAGCNTGIGKFGDYRSLLLSAIRYLDKHTGREGAVPALSVVSTRENAS